MISKIGAEVHSENSFLQYEKTAPAEVRKRQVGVTLSPFVHQFWQLINIIIDQCQQLRWQPLIRFLKGTPLCSQCGGVEWRGLACIVNINHLLSFLVAVIYLHRNEWFFLKVPGGGSYSIQKYRLQLLDLQTGLFLDGFQKKNLQYDLPKIHVFY